MIVTTRSPDTAIRRCDERVDHRAVSLLRSYLIWLLPPPAQPEGTVILHYVVEESGERAAEVASQEYSGYRIIGLRDVSSEPTAA